MIYKERTKTFNKEKILQLHINCYFGEKENVEKEININLIKNFKETLCYCLSEGIKRNFEFAEYCNKNFYFENNEYKNSLTISYILNGKWDDNLVLDINEIICELYKIKKEKILELIKIEALKDLLAYLCILKEEKEIFKLIKNPKMIWQTEILVKCLNLPNYFDNGIVYDEAINFSWLPIKFKEYNNDELYTEIFEKKINYNNLREINFYKKSDNLTDLTNIKSIEKYIMYNEIKTNKKITENGIKNDVRIAKIAKRENVYLNEHCSKFCSIDEEIMEDIIINVKPFLIYLNIGYSLKYIKNYDEKYKWLIIYTNILSDVIIKKNLIENEQFVEYNCLKAAYMVCRKTNIKRLNILLEKTKKCYKLFDIDKSEFLNEKEKVNIENIKLDKKFDVNTYIFEN
nr:putative immunity function [Saccharomycopsis crataegensis]